MTSKELRDYALTLTDNDSIESMEKGNTLKGFYLEIGRNELFFVTDRKNKTQKLASDILWKLLLPNNPDTRSEILYWLASATCHKLNPGTIVNYNRSCFYTDELIVIAL